MKQAYALLSAALLAACAAAPASGQNVKITPLGSHPGEFCDRDRAMLFEDPSGVRILYDAGHSVTSAEDARLGDIHAVLLSHAHGDHIGDRKLKAIGAGTCARPETVPAGPHSTTGEIAAAKNAVIVAVVDLAVFIGKKVEAIRGKPTTVCQQTGGMVSVPVAAACRSNTHLGGTIALRAPNAKTAVQVTNVFASHANSVATSLLSDQLRTAAATDAAGISLGPPIGFVAKFTNGLTVYLTGDTGIHTEMKSVVNDYHRANLTVFNLGPNAIDAQAGAYAVNELIRPVSVIVSHANEAVTEGGKLRPNTRTAAFVKLLKTPAHLAISGRTMEFDGKGRCVSGCD
jgi:L-ascorbate metabolism protein UlaG (beta-lactamase superfamily)